MTRGRALSLALAALTFNGCGAGPSAPPPVIVVTPTTVPGGVISGKYVLRIEPARECGAPRSVFTFRVDGRPDDTGRRPGVQVVLETQPLLEMEFQYATPNLLGNIGTTHDGVFAAELPNALMWVHGIAVGSVTSESGGPGEVMQGTLMGHVAFNEEGARCFSATHRWSLRLR